MNPRIAFACGLIVLLPACSTPVPEPIALIPPPEFSRELPPEPPATPAFRACKLGTACMALDERPFEVCLVSGGKKRCIDKAKPMEALGPDAPLDPEVVETAGALAHQ